MKMQRRQSKEKGKNASEINIKERKIGNKGDTT